MFNNFDLEGCKILKDAEKERKELKHPYVGSEHLLLSILRNSKEISNIFKSYDVTYNSFKNELIKVIGKVKHEQEINLYTPLLKRIIASSIEHASENNRGKVLPNHYILALLEESEGIAFRMLLGMGVNIDKLHKDLKNIQANEQLYLDEIGINLNESVNLDESILKRDDKINQIIEILIRKKKNNPILIGEAGVGKTAIVEELARRIVLKQVPEFLENKKIIMLEMGSLVAGTKYRGEFEEKLTRLINEVINNDEIILFIDEIHTMINAGGAEGAINASDILKPYLARGKIKCIGATTPLEYEKTILKDKALSRRFEKIFITEPDKDELAQILLGIKKEYEDFHKVKISEKNIDDIIMYSDKFIANKFNPDKSIDLLDTVCAYVKMKKYLINDKSNLKNKINSIIESKELAIKENRFDEAIKLKNKEFLLSKKLNNKKVENVILEEDILKIVSDKINIPLPEMQKKYIEKINAELKKSLFNQDNTIDNINNILRDHFMKDINKPLAIHLKGFNNVELKAAAKVFSKVYEKKYPVINIDFKEFKDSTSLNKLIGATPGYVGFGEDYILKKISDNTFAVVIIENFNDGNISIKNLIKSIVERGKFLNGKGELICCSNVLFVLISTINKTNDLGFCDGVIKIDNDNYLFGSVVNFEDSKQNV